MYNDVQANDDGLLLSLVLPYNLHQRPSAGEVQSKSCHGFSTGFNNRN
jgi:hypothetical protein